MKKFLLKLVPKKKRWATWSMPTKVSYIGSIFGVLVAILYIITLIRPTPWFEKQEESAIVEPLFIDKNKVNILLLPFSYSGIKLNKDVSFLIKARLDSIIESEGLETEVKILDQSNSYNNENQDSLRKILEFNNASILIAGNFISSRYSGSENLINIKILLDKPLTEKYSFKEFTSSTNYKSANYQSVLNGEYHGEVEEIIYFLYSLTEHISGKNISAINTLKKHRRTYVNYETYFLLSNCYREIGKLDSAIFYCNEAIKKDSSRVKSYIQKANILSQQEKHKEALNTYNIALKLVPNYNYLYILRGFEYQNLGDTLLALTDFMVAWERQRIPLAAHLIGDLYNYKQVIDTAIYFYGLAIQFDPKLYLSYNNRGLLNREKKYYKKALDDFSEAINISPGTSAFYINRANVYAEDMGMYESALIDYKTAISLDPMEASVYAGIGNIYYINKEFEKAAAYYNYAVRYDTLNYDYLYNYATFLSYTSEIVKAEEIFMKAISLDKSRCEAYVGLGDIYINDAKYELAKHLLMDCIKNATSCNRCYFKLGNVATKTNKNNEAIILYTKAIELDSEDADAYFNRGVCYSILEDLDLSLADVNKAISIDPERVEFLLVKGKILLNQRRFKEARIEFKRIIDLDSTNFEAKQYYAVADTLIRLNANIH